MSHRTTDLFAQRSALTDTLLLSLTADAAAELPPYVTALRFTQVDGYVNEHGLSVERYFPVIYVNGVPLDETDEDIDVHEVEDLVADNGAVLDLGYLLVEVLAQPGYLADLTNFRTGQ